MSARMTTAGGNGDGRAGSLGEVPVGSNGAVLFRERIGEIGREATHRVRKEMARLGRKIRESKYQGSEGRYIKDEEEQGALGHNGAP